MKQLSNDDVRHIGKLARLQISDEEVSVYSQELTAILAYIETLSEVDTSSVEPLTNVTNSTNQFRADEVTPPEKQVNQTDLLETSPLPIIDNQIQTPSAHG